MENVPEMVDFVSYLKAQVRLLDTVQGIEATGPVDIATEVVGRKRAIEIMVGILSPLVSLQDFEGNTKNDYAIDI